MSKEPFTFISYNKKDKEIAEFVALILKAEGVRVWFDEWEVTAGDSIIQEINKGLKPCTHFFVLWSINSSKSNWVRKELNSTLSRAIQNQTLKVLPLRLDEKPLPPLLEDISYIRFTEDIEKNRRNIIKAVLGIPPQNTYHQAIEKAYKELLKATEFGTLCSKCGSLRLESFTAIDYHHDEIIDFIRCMDCDHLEG